MMDDDTQLLTSSDQKMDDASTENPAAPRADSLSSDDSGDSDSDSEDEAESIQQIETLESELSANPYNYDAYVQVTITISTFHFAIIVFQLTHYLGGKQILLIFIYDFVGVEWNLTFYT